MSRAGAALFPIVLALSACGDAVSKAKPATVEGFPSKSLASGIAETPVQIVTSARGSLVGALERPAVLRRFFEALARLESGQARTTCAW